MRQERAEALTKKVYADAKKEWNRLSENKVQELEFENTIDYLDKILPKHGRILDAGGGPGKYAIYLAKKGYRISLLDLSKEHVEFARSRVIKEKVSRQFDSIGVGSILDLSRFKNNTFDAVLCLGGPLSHVAGEANRKTALAELTRVAKTGAPIFVSVFGKWGTMATAAVFYPQELSFRKHAMEMILRGEDRMWHGKYYGHFFTLDEALGLFSKVKNLRVLKAVGLEGLSSTWPDKSAQRLARDKKAWKNWMDIHKKIREIPAVIDMSLHFLIIARKKD